MAAPTRRSPAALLAAVGRTDPALVPIVLDALVRRYELLDGELASSTQVFPGVVAAVDALTAAGAVQSVVTGNVEVAARRKLAAAGLLGHLRLDLAAFGSDHADRAELVELALGRAAAAGYEVRRERVWIVGDTPRDLACARRRGALPPGGDGRPTTWTRWPPRGPTPSAPT